MDILLKVQEHIVPREKVAAFFWQSTPNITHEFLKGVCGYVSLLPLLNQFGIDGVVGGYLDGSLLLQGTPLSPELTVKVTSPLTIRETLVDRLTVTVISPVKGKLEMIRKEDYTPQMQLQHALKDARLALENAPQGTMPMMADIVDMWTQASQGGLAEQDLAAVYAWLDNARKA